MPLSVLADGLRPFTLLGENIVVFLDANGQPATLRDRCHRTARLSKGWCVDAAGKACRQGDIQCGYHGWTYAPTGQVINTPQFEAGRTIVLDYKTTAYYATARYGHAWVSFKEPIADIPSMPKFADPAFRTIFRFYERWQTSPMQALGNSFDRSHFSFVHHATFGVAASPKPSKYKLVENDIGFYAESIIDVANLLRFQRISGVKNAITTRHMRNAYFLPFSRRLNIEYSSGIWHIIINCFAPIDDCSMMLYQWLFRNDTEADCPAQMLIDFDAEITQEDKKILESTDPDAAVDLRRRGVEFSMDSDPPGILIRRKLMELLTRHGEAEVHG